MLHISEILWSLIRLCSVGITLYVAHGVYKYFNKSEIRPGKKIPGMKGIPLLGNALQYVKISWPIQGVSPNVYTMQVLSGLSKLFEKEGIFKFHLATQEYYLIYNARFAEGLLKSNIFIDKPGDYDYFQPWLGSGLITSANIKWKVRRKLLTPTFHFKILDTFHPIMEERSMALVNKLKGHSKPDNCEISTFLELCTMDIICETAMGYPVNSLDNQDSVFIRSLHCLGDLVIRRMLTPWLWPTILWNLSSTGRRFNKSNTIVQNLITQVISDKKKELMTSGKKKEGERPAFLDLILEQHLQNPELTEKDILDEVNTFMFAGQDTTSAGMTWCLYLLGHNPEIQDKVAEELYSVFGDDRSRSINLDDLKELKYLECTIKEAQRLYPSVPLIGRKIVEDFWIDDECMIPKGSCLVLATRELSQDKENFPEPDVFKPERFTPENSKGRNPFAYVPFSAGPRNCIGQRFAMIEMKTILGNLLRNFSIRSLDPFDQISVNPEVVSRPSRRLKFQITPRVFTC